MGNTDRAEMTVDCQQVILIKTMLSGSIDQKQRNAWPLVKNAIAATR